VVALLGSLEGFAEHLELRGRDGALCHVETDSELGSSDVARSKLVEVSKEFANSDSLLRAQLANACNNIINIVRVVPHDFSTALAGLGLREVGKGVVEVSADAEELGRVVNVFAEVNIVHFVNVALVHVAAEHELTDVPGGVDLEQVEHTEELGFGDMAVLGDVEVLEQRLEEDSSGVDSESVLLQNVFDVDVGIGVFEVLSASEKGVRFSDRLYLSGGSLVNTLDSESKVDAGGESRVVEEDFGVVGSLLVSKRFKLVLGEGEVHGGEDRFELVSSDTTLSKLVEILEELFNSDSLHDDDGAEAILNIVGVVGDIDTLVHETVGNDVQFAGGLLEEGADLVGGHAESVGALSDRLLGLVAGEHVFRAVDILDKEEIVDFLSVSTIAILADDEVEDFLGRRHHSQGLQDTEELLSSDVIGLGAIEVHEAGLEQNSVADDLLLER